LANAAGAIVIDVHKCTMAAFPTNATIFATAPTITATAQYARNLTLNIPLNRGDILDFQVDSVTTITRCTLILHMRRV
jgi:hypothetical protein